MTAMIVDMILCSLRGWHLIIILGAVFVLLVIPFLLGVRVGRRSGRRR